MEILTKIPINHKLHYEVSLNQLDAVVSDRELFTTLFGDGDWEVLIDFINPINRSFFHARRFEDELEAYRYYNLVCSVLKSNPTKVLKNHEYFGIHILDFLTNSAN